MASTGDIVAQPAAFASRFDAGLSAASIAGPAPPSFCRGGRTVHNGYMNKSVWLARLLGLGGVLETLAGLGLLVDPAGGAAALLGSPLEGPGMTIGRIGGGGLLALGIACWLARK